MGDSYSSSGSDAASSIIGGFFACYALFILVVLAVTIFVFYKICQKTGNSGWLALLNLVPFGSMGLMLYLAFSDWPVLRENRDLRARAGYIPPGSPGGYGAGYAPPAPPMAPTAPYPGQPYASPQPQPPSGFGEPPVQPPMQP